MAKLFISYSHKDEALRQELEVQLSMLRRQGLIEVWNDRRILAGDAVDGTISRHLEEADVVLLLVSADFLASNYCYEREMTRAMERQAAGEVRVIPVILRPCDWMHPPLSSLMATPTDGKPVTKWPDKDDAMVDVARAIRSAVEAMAPSPVRRTPSARPPALSGPVPERPRSSNLRIRQEFSDHDRHVFLEDAYGFIANYFEGSLEELERRNPGIQTSFRRIDADHFSATIFRHGSRMSGCRIWLGGFGSSRNTLFYSAKENGADNSWNESISVDADSQSLYLRSTGMASYAGADREGKLTAEGGAELFWTMLIQPLQG
ncbi:toll/interleukin-1 receptor domain-containing protein [Azospirillum melinis]|uniref:toll/interleukin-1 receptor domain-containing protein n=1 Tax=Azospirillum TaxID=191 RepID=UPI000D62015F|nr:toll/interleukin-1 receptor domain-containing protein [Azospirillum sp. TSA6c]PWC47895.1 hypothetical protein TSA6c_15430 [Azospirillum sp. TSA6c]